MLSKSRKNQRGYFTSRRKAGVPSLSLKRFAYDRNAHVVSRCPIGTNGLVALNGSGAITTIGGFSSAGFRLEPGNLGWVLDMASHFAYWKLHRARLRYVPVSLVTDSSGSGTFQSAGIAVVSIMDDPGRAPGVTAGLNQLELRSAGEFNLSRSWVLDYIPTGPAADWLFCDRTGQTSASTMRQVDAGTLMFSSLHNSGHLSATVGYIEIEFDVSFKGAVMFLAPTAIVLKGEEKKEIVSSTGLGLGATAPRFSVGDPHPEEGYELVSQFVKPVTLRTVGAGTPVRKS